jgi:hypothetical protein
MGHLSRLFEADIPSKNHAKEKLILAGAALAIAGVGIYEAVADSPVEGSLVAVGAVAVSAALAKSGVKDIIGQLEHKRIDISG